ncbi:MAG: CBS domain-containing protein [Candidatus Omnitrophica bacterium]|jgi:CBS domain-containing protein|nr:CBS domain-containing protein [Candidatus Omnitrophota bacterium]
MFKIEDIMSRSIVTVKKDTNIYDAMNMMLEHKISGLPVVDDNMRLEGIISEKDILKILVDGQVTDTQKVADYMRSEVVSFCPQDSVVQVCEFLIQNPFRRVPILKDGILVGIVARRDIISLILRLRSKIKKS